MHFMHDIESGTEDSMNVIIEIPAGSKNKYEINKETGLIMLDRAMHTAQDYPTDYGFVPQTFYDDGDALDVIVLSTFPLCQGVLVKVRPVGVIYLTDDGDADDKILGVPTNDPRWDHIKDVGDINQHTLKTIQHFFETYKGLQNKIVKIGKIGGAKEAKEAFHYSKKMYKEKFGK